jgi:hypothetical protein
VNVTWRIICKEISNSRIVQEIDGGARANKRSGRRSYGISDVIVGRSGVVIAIAKWAHPRLAAVPRNSTVGEDLECAALKRIAIEPKSGAKHSGQ